MLQVFPCHSFNRLLQSVLYTPAAHLFEELVVTVIYYQCSDPDKVWSSGIAVLLHLPQHSVGTTSGCCSYA